MVAPGRARTSFGSPGSRTYPRHDMAERSGRSSRGPVRRVRCGSVFLHAAASVSVGGSSPNEREDRPIQDQHPASPGCAGIRRATDADLDPPIRDARARRPRPPCARERVWGAAPPRSWSAHGRSGCCSSGPAWRWATAYRLDLMPSMARSREDLPKRESAASSSRTEAPSISDSTTPPRHSAPSGRTPSTSQSGSPRSPTGWSGCEQAGGDGISTG